jgi:uncharacterized DUF497 family protein
MTVQFEWDPIKAQQNIEKHQVSFEEAQTVFANPNARIIADEWHSDHEEREIIIGHSQRNRLLFVVFVERIQLIIRIISARLATKKERNDYEQSIQG